MNACRPLDRRLPPVVIVPPAPLQLIEPALHFLGFGAAEATRAEALDDVGDDRTATFELGIAFPKATPADHFRPVLHDPTPWAWFSQARRRYVPQDKDCSMT